MVRVELTHVFPISVGEGFAFITDTGNWNEFFPDFVRLCDPENARWNAPGERVKGGTAQTESMRPMRRAGRFARATRPADRA